MMLRNQEQKYSDNPVEDRALANENHEHSNPK